MWAETPADIIYVKPNSPWGEYVRGLFSTRRLEDASESKLKHLLGAQCHNCCDKWSDKTVYLSGRTETVTTLTNDGLRAWGHIGGLHMDFVARCTIRNCCDHCKAACMVTFDVWDNWHWGTQGGLFIRHVGDTGIGATFEWHVWYQKVRLFKLKCAAE